MPTEGISKEEFAELVGRKEPSLAVLGVGVGGRPEGHRHPGPRHLVRGEAPSWVGGAGRRPGGTRRPLWEDQENQARIYGLLLERMGFDCSRLQLAVVRLKSGELGEDEKRRWIAEVSGALLEGKTMWLEVRRPGRMKVHLLKHEPAKAEKAVASKAGYWLGEREPTSSSSVGKCRACEYSSSCPKSLFRP